LDPRRPTAAIASTQHLLRQRGGVLAPPLPSNAQAGRSASVGPLDRLHGTHGPPSRIRGVASLVPSRIPIRPVWEARDATARSREAFVLREVSTGWHASRLQETLLVLTTGGLGRRPRA